MHIAVDMDDTILDLSGGLQKSLKKEFGIEADVVDLAPGSKHDKLLWDWLGRYLDEESWVKDRDWVWATFDAIDGSMGWLRELRKQGHNLEIITSKPKWAEWVTWKWLGRWRPPVHRVTITPLGGDKPRWSYTDAILLIDDDPRHCAAWDEQGRYALLLDRPWNRDAILGPRTRRLDKWGDVMRNVQRIEEETIKEGE